MNKPGIPLAAAPAQLAATEQVVLDLKAAAMSVCIVGIGLAVRLGYWALMRGVHRRTQAWREPREASTGAP